MTDKELAASVRDLFVALRKAIGAAQEAGLYVEFSDRVQMLLHEPNRGMWVHDIQVTRSL